MRRGLLLVSAALALITPPTALAEIRSGTFSDPQDAEPTISGVPNNPDISQVRAVYDTAGSFSLTISFYNSINGLDLSQNYAFYGQFAIADNCQYIVYGGLDGQHHVMSNVGQFYDRGTIFGYDGYLAFSRSTAPDGRSITVSGSSPALANHDWRCLSYDLGVRRLSTASSLSSDYDSSCDCWYISYPIDTLGRAGSDPLSGDAVMFFDGYAPANDPPDEDQPNTKRKTDYWQKVKRTCRGLDLSYWRLLPNRVKGITQPFSGRLVFELSARGADEPTRTKRSRLKNWIKWRVPKGRYTLASYYTGDKWRDASNVITKRVRAGKPKRKC